MAILAVLISFSQEHYNEVKKLYMKNPNGTSKVENHDIEVLFTKSSKSCIVRIDNNELQIFQILSERYNDVFSLMLKK